MWSKENKTLFFLLAIIGLQSFLYIEGPRQLTYLYNPIIFVLVSYSLFHIFFFTKRIKINFQKASTKNQLVLAFFIGIMCLLSSYEELRKIFVHFPLPTPNSDVIGQLETLYTRWADGVFPYSKVTIYHHAPFPVYMPLHWLPMGLSLETGIDTRWSAIIIYIICSAIYMALLLKKSLPLVYNIIIAVLPAFVLWLHIIYLKDDIAVSPEYLIGGYYLLLGAALIKKNISWIVVGVILCILSRYTFVFWLPVLFIYSFKAFGWRKSMMAFGAVVLAVLVLYVPFLIADPTILKTGLDYHNGCAIGELTPSGDHPMGWTYSYGIHFAIYFRTFFNEMAPEQLGYIIRTCQAAVMLITCFLGIFSARSINYKFEKNSIAFLYLTTLLFFSFSPLSYRYYYFSLIVLSVLLVAQYLYSLTDEKVVD